MPTINHSVKLISAIIAAIKGNAAITALIGSGASARLYGGRAAQNSALPRIIFHEISTTDDYQHDSGTSTDAGITESVIQFDAEGRTLTAARGLVDALAALFSGATITSATAHIQAGFRESGGFSRPLEHDSGDGEKESHRISSDFRFLWKDFSGVILNPSGGFVLNPDSGYYIIP